MLMRIALMCTLAQVATAANTPFISYTTYLGGTFAEIPGGIAVDPYGSAYVAGTTNSPDFPITSTSLGVPSVGTDCAFVTKLNPTGTAIDLSFCLANYYTIAFTLDANGNMYLLLNGVAGGGNFTGYSVVKVDPTGQNMIYNTPVNGANSLAVDPAGNVYVVGAAGPGLATTPGVYQAGYAGGECPGLRYGAFPCYEAFITKLTPSGSIAWTTYLGGSGGDGAVAAAVDSLGNVWVAGGTSSTDFPTTQNAISRTYDGGSFLAELDSTGSRLLYSTYVDAGGISALAVDATGAAYLTSINDPSQPIQFGGLTKVDAAGRLAYAVGIGRVSGPPRIAVDPGGQAYVGVVAAASTTPTQPTCASTPASDVLVFDSTGSQVASSPIPGGYLAVDGKGGLYSTGYARVFAFLSTAHAFQTAYGGGDSDVFAAKADFSQLPGSALASAVNAASQSLGIIPAFFRRLAR